MTGKLEIGLEKKQIGKVGAALGRLQAFCAAALGDRYFLEPIKSKGGPFLASP
jgi:hypothetical protein